MNRKMKGIERLAIATIDSFGLKADENLSVCS